MTGNEILKLRGNMPREAFARMVGCSTREIFRWEKKGYKEVRMLRVYEERMYVMSKKLRRSE